MRWVYTIWFRENAGTNIMFDREQRATGPDGVKSVVMADRSIEQRLEANSELRLAVTQRMATISEDGFDRESGDLWVWHRFFGHNERGDRVRVDVRFRLDGSGRLYVSVPDR
jgi:hypothetical protein